jgi:hypothetical protein
MECLSPEQTAAYLRGRGDARRVESHVRDCPACAIGLLLARETLHELKARTGRPATDRVRIPTRRSTPWVPWAAAAAVLFVAILVFALRPSAPPAGPVVRREETAPKAEPVRAPEPPAREPRKPDPPPPLPEPPAPKPEPRLEPGPKPDPKPDPKPEAPRPGPDPKPEPRPEPPGPKPEPKPEPRKPAPTVVERTAIARVTRTAGGTALGRMLFAGDTLSTGRQEFVEVALDGYGSLYFRENSKAEIGLAGEINLHDGGMMAKVDAGRRLGLLKTPAAEVEVQSSLFDVQAARGQTEVSIADGSAAIGPVVSKGPSALLAKPGKAAEVRPLDPGFASWLPDRLAAKRFAGWFEGESFTALQGFKAADQAQASGGRAAVQTAEGGTALLKAPLPFKGRHAVWLRMRTYEAKSTAISLHLNGQALGEIKIDPEAKPWRWVGPFFVISDRLELAVTAMGRFPASTTDRIPFPVAIDTVWTTSDVKAAPPEKLGDDRRPFDFAVEEPPK